MKSKMAISFVRKTKRYESHSYDRSLSGPSCHSFFVRPPQEAPVERPPLPVRGDVAHGSFTVVLEPTSCSGGVDFGPTPTHTHTHKLAGGVEPRLVKDFLGDMVQGRGKGKGQLRADRSEPGSV